MTAARSFELVSVEDYLAGELVARVRHEYIGGVVHARAGGTLRHARIAGNIFASLHGQLRGKPCQAYASDTKVHAPYWGQTRFYYPDASVVCESNEPEATHEDHPVIVFEVLSRSTRRIDTGEKCEAYLAIRSLEAYVLVEQDEAAIKVMRRSGDEWITELYRTQGDEIRLSQLGLVLRLNEVYEGVAFGPEPGGEEEYYS